MSQSDKAQAFKALHDQNNPLVLYNIWDAGGAQAVAKAGAKAVATGSWSVAAAHGFADGQALPLDFALTIVRCIAQSVDLPLTVDFEGGYAKDPSQLAINVTRVMEAGAIGINFEDQIIRGKGLYSIADQVARIAAIRRAADDAGLPLFINARTDIFLKADASDHADLMEEAQARQKAYAQVGADGFFVPGLVDAMLIQTICQRSALPINVMMMGDRVSVPRVARLGVSRISFGPGPYINAIDDLTARFKAI